MSGSRGLGKLPLFLMVTSSMVLVIFVFLLAKSTTVSANTGDIASAEAKYPNIVGTRIDTCNLCHVPNSIPNLNPYGAAYKAAGRNPTAFAPIENTDSDKDGWTNIQEILALTFPGDPNDHPMAPTSTPTSTVPVPSKTATSTSVPPTVVPPTATSTSVPPTVVPPTVTSTVGNPTATPIVTVTTPAPTVTPTVVGTINPTPTVQCKSDDEDENESDENVNSTSGSSMSPGTSLDKHGNCEIEKDDGSDHGGGKGGGGGGDDHGGDKGGGGGHKGGGGGHGDGSATPIDLNSRDSAWVQSWLAWLNQFVASMRSK